MNQLVGLDKNEFDYICHEMVDLILKTHEKAKKKFGREDISLRNLAICSIACADTILEITKPKEGK